MNVASLTGSSYEQVTVNSLSFSPGLLLNLSLFALDKDDSQGRRLDVLHALAAGQDTLLELSGVPFSVVSFLSSGSLLVPKTAVLGGRDSQQARDEEALFYLGVGAAVALLLAVCLLLCVLHSIRHPLLHPGGGKHLPPPLNFRYNDPPTAIYSEQFVNNKTAVAASLSDDRSDRHQSRSGASGTFTPLDDNLYPVATEVDFTPRYLLEQEGEDMAAACYRADSPMPELTRLLAAEDGDDEEEVGWLRNVFLFYNFTKG